MQARHQKTPSAPDRIVITGIGLMTPVGDSCWDTLRAIREGRSAYRSHETCLVLGSPGGDALRGATISRMRDDLLPRDLSGAQRIEALLVAPIRECLTALPETLHGYVDWKIILSQSVTPDSHLLSSLAGKIRRIQRDSGEVCVTPNPRCEFFNQLTRAGEALRTRRIEGVVVASADSLCDTARLNDLMLAGRLKDPDNPYGILAGEAGGAVLLERESAARLRNAPILAAISAWGNAVEPNPWPTGKPSKALGLTTAFHQAFEKLNDKGAGVTHVSSDENGERARALEWALTSGRIFPNPQKERHLWHPAMATGDAGSAMSAVVLADALARLILSATPSERVVLCVSDDEGGRQTLCLESVEQPEQEEFFSAIRNKMGVEKISQEKK